MNPIKKVLYKTEIVIVFHGIDTLNSDVIVTM